MLRKKNIEIVFIKSMMYIFEIAFIISVYHSTQISLYRGLYFYVKR